MKRRMLTCKDITSATGPRVQWLSLNTIIVTTLGSRWSTKEWVRVQGAAEAMALVMEAGGVIKTRRSTDSRCIGMMEVRRTFSREWVK